MPVNSLYIKLTAMFCAAVLPLTAAAQDTALLARMQWNSLPVQRQRLSEYSANPGQMFFRDSLSLSRLSAGTDILRQEKAVMQQLGDGHTLFSIGAESYMRLTSASGVWGSAYFTTGKYNNIKWTDCIDYQRVAPYVLGDEAGGNLSTRRYTFSGGYSRLNGSWSYGIDAAYRAEIAYRNRDPRVKTIVSDLDIRLGAAHGFGRYSLGLSAAVNVYNQSCDLDFYNPVNDINTYTLTGMGTYYRRFMGNDNKNSGSTSFGYTLGLQWLPVRGLTGPSAQVSYNGYRMSQQLRSFNNLTLGYTDNRNVKAQFAWGFRISDGLLLRPRLCATYSDRKGTENLFGSSAGSSYEKIGSRRPYSHSVTDGTLELPLQWSIGYSYLTVCPSVSYHRSLEKYTEPERQLEASHISPALKLDFSSRPSGKWLWNVGLDGFYSAADSKAPVLTGLDTATPLGQCVLSNFDMLGADRYGVGISARVSRRLGSFALSVEVSFNYIDYKNLGDSRATGVTVSASF